MTEEVIDKAEKKVEDPLATIVDEKERELVRGWKNEGIPIFMVYIAGTPYYYRSFNRVEWRQMLKEQTERIKSQEGIEAAEAQLLLEEGMVMKCSMFPKFSRDNVRVLGGAGVVTTLYESIMWSSGFSQEPIPVQL